MTILNVTRRVIVSVVSLWLLIGLFDVIGQLVTAEKIILYPRDIFDDAGQFVGNQLLLMDTERGLEIRIDTVHDFGSEAGWSPGGRFVYVLDQFDDGPRHLRVIDLESRRIRTLTEQLNRSSCSVPVWWSRDGQYVAFQEYIVESRQTLLQVYDTVNDRIDEIPGPGEYFNDNVDFLWSPDGRYVVASNLNYRQRDTSGHIVILWDALEKQVVEIPDVVATTDFAWSSDGRLLAFEALVTDSYRRDVHLFDLVNRIRHDVNPDTSDERLLSWSPGGNKLLISALDSPAHNTFLFDADHLTLQALGDAHETHQFHSWSPDGTQILLTTPSDTPLELVFWDVAHNHISQRYQPGTTIAQVLHAWSSDERYYAFVGQPKDPNRRDYSMMIIDTMTQRLTTSIDGLPIYGALYWSPDSTQLAFLTNEQGYKGDASDLIVVDATDGINHHAADSVRNHYQYTAAIRWSPDARALMFENQQGMALYDTMTQQRLELGQGDNGSWIGDGHELRFWSSRSGHNIPHIFNIDSGQFRPAPETMSPFVHSYSRSRGSTATLGLTWCGMG